MENALRESEASLKKAEILTKSGHFEKNLETNISKWSDGMYILMGYEPQSFEVSAENDDKLLPPKSIKRMEKAYHTALRGNKEFEIEVEAVTKGNDILTLLIKAVIETDGKKPVKMLATCQDITSRKEHLEHIEYISYHDQLTGLYNRRFFEEELSRLDVQRNYPLAVIMADINGLKLANDTFGHTEGDRMLVNASEVLKHAVRKDDIIARIGGDEFMILLPKIEKDAVVKIMGRILEDTKSFQTTTLPLSIALGSAIKNDGKISSDELFKSAEDEMYRNKLHEVSSRRNEAIKIISDTLYEKNKREEAHSERVGQISVMLGTAVGLTRPELNELKTLGLMHDIGKIAVEDEYLNKPSALTAEEFENIKKHPEAGFRILSTSTDMSDLAEYVLSHHERWDGKGYPRGLAGEEIPLMARIVAIAESYDAMTSKAPYRRPLPHNKAYLEIRKNSGSQFDPVLVKTFLQDVWPDLA
jgi:diguanylate cyclase (GGDEF)-like protein/PAS domain S-box-containing protein